jgi:surface polysaccharide O-acyltransferase-like enzyme
MMELLHSRPQLETIAEAPAPRRVDIELLRALSALAVIAVHVGGLAITSDVNTPTYWTGLIFASAGMFAVPVFFAISGWVFTVRSPIGSSSDLQTRLLRVGIPLMVWTVVYGLLGWRQGAGDPLQIWKWALLGRPAYYHLWFIYAYVALLLVIGIATLLLRHRSAGNGWRLLVPLGLVSLIPSLLYPRGYPNSFRPPIWVFTCALLGAALLIERHEDARFRVSGAMLFIAGVAGTIIVAHRYGSWPDVPTYGSVSVIASAIGVLLLVRGLNLQGVSERAIRTLGRASFGVYLVHALVLFALTKAFERAGVTVAGRMAPWMIPLLIILTYAASTSLAVAWSRVPAARRWLG